MPTLRNVAVVSFAQLPIVARDEHRMATEMLYPVVRQALAECGVDREAIDYQVAGSTDYMDGRPFGFVTALDVMGSWPAKQDLHLEMDAGFCAYYAWLRMQAGDCDTALVVGHGKTSEGDPNRVLNLQLDPYYQAPIGLDPTSSAALVVIAIKTSDTVKAALQKHQDYVMHEVLGTQVQWDCIEGTEWDINGESALIAITLAV